MLRTTTFAHRVFFAPQYFAFGVSVIREVVLNAPSVYGPAARARRGARVEPVLRLVGLGRVGRVGAAVLLHEHGVENPGRQVREDHGQLRRRRLRLHHDRVLRRRGDRDALEQERRVALEGSRAASATRRRRRR
jgi:hypothetical protein